MSAFTFYASSRRSVTDDSKRNNTPCCYPSVDERQEISKMEARYPKPEFITRMMPLEAAPPKREEGDKKEDEPMEEEEQPHSTTPKEPETDPVSPEVDPIWTTKMAKGDRYHRQQHGQIHHIQDHSRPKKMNHLHHLERKHTTMFKG